MLAGCLMLVSCLAYSSTLKMEDIRSPETLVEFNRTTQRYIPPSREPQIQQNPFHALKFQLFKIRRSIIQLTPKFFLLVYIFSDKNLLCLPYPSKV
jgi:hypothetical protein